MTALVNPDTVARPTADEAARQKFVSSLRQAIMVDLAGEMRRRYDDEIDPKPNRTKEVRLAMEKKPIYKFYSALRYKAQEMVWESVRPQIERNLPDLIEAADEARRLHPTGGSLKLDPALEMPHYVTKLDVHLMPGCFHSEYVENDVAQGAMYAYGVGVFSGGLKLMRQGGGPGASIAHFLAEAHPNFRPRKILDLGCTAGSNTFPYHDVFPQAELHGIDVGAPLLRYGHARAEAMGVPIHFAQMNAEKMDFPDESFDLVTSSFFLHEIPLKATRNVFEECRRILRPGGLMIHFELPPGSEVDPYYDFYLDWDTLYNNEPSYAQFRAQIPAELCAEAGFDRAKFVKKQLFNWGTVPPETFAACARGEITAQIQPNGGSWFVFGGWK